MILYPHQFFSLNEDSISPRKKKSENVLHYLSNKNICLWTESLALLKFKDNAAIIDPLFIKELVSVVNQAL